MTMRNPLIDAERHAPVAETYDPAKHYRYTWPGQAPRVVTGRELAEIVAGADASLLAIQETSQSITPSTPSAAPPAMRAPYSRD